MEGGFDSMHCKNIFSNVILRIERVFDNQSRTRNSERKVSPTLRFWSERNPSLVKIEFGSKKCQESEQQSAKIGIGRSAELEKTNNDQNQAVGTKSTRIRIIKRAFRQELFEN